MAGDPQIEFRVSRLENDVSAIYHLIADVRVTQDAHFRRFDDVDHRFDGIDRRFDGMDARFDGIDQRFDRMDERFGSFEATLAEVVRRLPGPA